MVDIDATIETTVIDGVINFDVVYIGVEDEESRQKLYTWMIAHDYDVTATMTIKQMIDVLSADVHATYRVQNGVLYIVDTSAKVENGVLYLYHGAEILNAILKIKDVN